MKTPIIDCQLHVELLPTPDGKPALYNFVWERIPELYTQTSDKVVETTLTLPHPKKQKVAHHFVEKLWKDRRYGMHVFLSSGKTPGLHIHVPTRHLDSFLSAYNVLVESQLPALTFHSPHLRIELPRGKKSAAILHTTKKLSGELRNHLKETISPAPFVHQVSFEEGTKSPSR